MSSTNDITGDKLISKHNSDKYRDNFSNIFKKPTKKEDKDDYPVNAKPSSEDRVK